MSVMRVICTDALRLGSPLEGLAGSPEWLRRIAASAVRQSVLNLCEAAVLSECQAILVNGRLVEQTSLLDAAVRWLRPHCEQLQAQGVSLILCGHPAEDAALLKSLPATIVVPQDRTFALTATADGLAVQLIESPGQTPSAGLLVCRGEFPSTSAFRLRLQRGDMSTDSQETGTSTWEFLRDAELQLNSPQAVHPAETAACGALIVELSDTESALTARFCATDVLRYCREEFRSEQPLERGELLQQLMQRSRRSTATRRVNVVDWSIQATLLSDLNCDANLEEQQLLSDLRETLQGGLSGFWPRRIRFAEDSRLQGQSAELEDLLCGLIPEAYGTGTHNSADQECCLRLIEPLPELLAALHRAA